MFEVVFMLVVLSVAAEVIDECIASGMFAITFDDGPSYYTSEILDILEREQVKATFHITTRFLDEPSDRHLLLRMVQEGHRVGLKLSYDLDWPNLDASQIIQNFRNQASIVESITGKSPKLVRIPYGRSDDRVVAVLESVGAIVTNYNLESADFWHEQERILEAFRDGLQQSQANLHSHISVQHDGIEESKDALRSVIGMIRENGYHLVTLDQCVGFPII